MNDSGDNPWASARPKPKSERKDKSERQRDAARGERGSDRPTSSSKPVRPAREAHGASDATHPGPDHGAPPIHARPADEMRLYGVNACLAAFAARPQDLRKVYLLDSRMTQLRDVLAHCVKQRLGYRVVEATDLGKLAASSHHEGVVFEMRKPAPPMLGTLLASLAAGPQLLLWLDGVGNPHNFGAVLRSAAHFGTAGILLPPDSPLTLSGAACRVAEGGAEMVPVVPLANIETALGELQQAGFTLAATLPSGGASIYADRLPERLVLVMGAEREGVNPDLAAACRLRLSIPGSGKVESLNIANAVGVMLSEHWRQHFATPH